MKTYLFDPITERFTTDGVAFTDEVKRALRPIVDRWRKSGVSLRHMQAAVTMASDDLIVTSIIRPPIEPEQPKLTVVK